MVRRMPEWNADQTMKMNRRVFDTLTKIECAQERSEEVNRAEEGLVFLIALEDKFNIVVRNKLIHHDMTRTDLKTISTVACKMRMTELIDVTQPVVTKMLMDREEEPLIEEGKIKIGELRKLL